MRTTCSVLMACGMLGAAATAAYADGGIRIKIGGIGIRVGSPPVLHCGTPPPPPCPPPPCHEPRYREEVIWETVPQTEVWYDACGNRHERTIYLCAPMPNHSGARRSLRAGRASLRLTL
ncbi:MAG: hypothetical protein ACKVW3_14795 [Phycisphaerales bacterium]